MSSERTVIPFPPAAAGEGPVFSENRPELNLRILWSLGRYVADHLGEATLVSIADRAGLNAGDLDGKTRWVSLERFEAFLAAARSLVADDATFRTACAWRLEEGYGPLRFVLWAVSPRLMYVQGVSNIKLISAISEYKVVDAGRNFIHGRYTSEKPESRLLCLHRQAQIEALPTLWRLPPAHVEELSCIAHGDDACEYRVRWYSKLGWLPTALGASGGLGALFFILGSGFVQPALAATLPVLGAALGYIVDLHRTHRSNLFLGEEINEALRQLAREDAEARRELIAIGQRQQEWARLMEDQVAERTGMLQEVVERIQKLQQQRHSTLRGFSHDLRNPLSVLKAETSILRTYLEVLGGEGPSIIEDHERAVQQMERLLSDLMDVATAEGKQLRVAPEQIDVAPLTERLRRRLRALVHGRDIRVSVFSTREAPELIQTDVLLLDRVLDNLLTNAAKYTERGSILVEVGGTPGYLTIKVSDTGRGIDADHIRAVFAPGGSDADTRAPSSYGVGLSIVLHLLGQIGGRLEVMSKPGVGTTFWAHFPETIQRPAVLFDDLPREDSAAFNELMSRVVTIRRIT